MANAPKAEAGHSLKLVPPRQAITIASPVVGGDVSAKSIIADRILDGTLQIFCSWRAAQHSGPVLPLKRPEENRYKRGPDYALHVQSAKLPGIRIAPAVWEYSRDVRADIERWNWAFGIFFSTIDDEYLENLLEDRPQALAQLKDIRVVHGNCKFVLSEIEDLAKANMTSATPEYRQLVSVRRAVAQFKSECAELISEDLMHVRYGTLGMEETELKIRDALVEECIARSGSAPSRNTKLTHTRRIMDDWRKAMNLSAKRAKTSN